MREIKIARKDQFGVFEFWEFAQGFNTREGRAVFDCVVGRVKDVRPKQEQQPVRGVREAFAELRRWTYLAWKGQHEAISGARE